MTGEVEATEKPSSQLYSLDLQFVARGVGSEGGQQVGGTVRGEFSHERGDRRVNMLVNYNIAVSLEECTFPSI